MSEPSQIFASSARAAALSPSEELLALARKRASEPDMFDGELKPFLFSAVISNQELDAHYTHMAESTLRNFAEDANAGVSFQNSHNNFELGFGRSLRGTYGEQRVVADFYTVPGLMLNGVSTDNLIAGIRSGLIADVSVGFYGGRHVCDICGFNLMDWENCSHYPGFEAEVTDKTDKSIKRLVMATATIEDARLAEVSAVYDGATPGAVILKAQQAVDAGRMPPKTARILEQRYRIKLPGARELFAGIGERDMKTRQNEDPNPNPAPEPNPASAPAEPTPEDVEQRSLSSVRALLTTRGVKEEAMPDSLRALAEAAADGIQYRADLVEQALTEGVRSKGAKFDRERFEKILGRSSIEEIKLFIEDWGGDASATFTGGRRTVDPELPDETQHATTSETVVSAYQ